MKWLILSLLSIAALHSRCIAQTICIDPGHGYGENGENFDSRTWEEISTNVAVGLYLRDSLEARGYAVIMTRENSDSNSWMSLTQRAELADYYESARFLSIHCNGGGGTGTETFWSARNTYDVAVDKNFSQITQNCMSEIGEWRNRRSAEDVVYLGFRLGVLKGFAAGCLNEIGFVDTPSDLEKLLDDDWRKVFAHAYAVAIDESFLEIPSADKKVQEDMFAIFPNPFTSQLTIDSNIPMEYKSLSIVNMQGQEVFYRSGGNNVINSLEFLPSGLYYLQIRTEASSYQTAILKQ